MRGCNAARLLCSLVALLTEMLLGSVVYLCKNFASVFFASDRRPRLVADDLLANAFILRSVTFVSGYVSGFASTPVLSP